MDSSLRERFARLGPIRAAGHAMSGSPAVFVLRLPADGTILRTISGMRALVRRGMSLARAKQAIETLVETRRVVVHLPLVEQPEILAIELAEAGIEAEPATVRPVGESAHHA